MNRPSGLRYSRSITDSQIKDRKIIQRSVLIADHDMHNPEARSSRELVPEPDRETLRRGEKPLARISRRINVYFDLAR